ncbi:MAG TPA: hypothetical protein VFB04_08555 [Terriglobales bacterium]|nr:hypothetical protein [Terriglobales bacterium]
MPAKVLRILAIPFVLSVYLLAACGGASENIAISIAPISATLNPGMQQQFQATVTGTSNTSVQWEVNNVAGGNPQVGTITAAGLYTAPGASDVTVQVTVTAVANANPNKTASAQVTVNGIGVGGR